MQDLFSSAPPPPVTAHEAKIEAVERVGANAPSEWMRKAMEVTRGLAQAKPQGFSSDDV